MAKRLNDNQIIDFEEIRELLHENAETGFAHTTYQEETRRFLYLINGDKRAITDSLKIMDPTIQGTLSKDPLRNMKYLFVVNTGLATRYLIEAGIPQETVYSTSDIYIQKADVAKTADEIVDLNREVWTVFVNLVREHKKRSLYSRPVLDCLNYIDSHFNMKLTLEELAEKVGLNPSYLATLFKKETGRTFGTYLTDVRIKTSQALLVRTDYTYSQIAYSIGFCSQSHFTATFRKYTGYTPKEYRKIFYNTNISTNISKKSTNK
ncbi:AraC-type DNA-binding protein [Lachnospiraceae bacterium NE2001]|nr:AraC-type DNA-binding protein [Lachnospiraceae bacterium NE2001]